ncbi:phage holin, lambda family [Zophobihabitans entericus]|uniref:Phage holin, lambda family n=2 Tax=Zophobihabitans entericus TaxID=1635327 RepID=A0A6G9IF01_9GAMM|nr:phage holin, lambda family [Zophobihabitans entericus]
MPYKNNDFFASVIDWLYQNYPLIYGAILAVLIAYVRLVYDGVDGRKKWIEAILCGALALAASSALDYFGLPQSLSPFIGGMIGFLGVEKLRAFSMAFFERRSKGNKE